MNTLLLACSIGAFFIAILGLLRSTEPIVKRVYAWVPLPVLVAGIFSSSSGVTNFPTLLLGTQIGLDSVGRGFLILISGTWLIANLFSRGYFKNDAQERLFRFYSLITYSGTIGLTIAQDAPSFYTGYAVMTIGGYGLIIHTKDQAALVAGRVYIFVALIGEMMTLAGLIIAASTAGSFSIKDIAASIQSAPMGQWSFWLIFLGFGTKVGLVPLHFWLPRSYYWAPLPAVAVLSGAMTKAGVLGWLRFLPTTDSPLTSVIVLCAGALMAFYGVIFGVLQTRSKTTLAFSSLSQMGYLTMAFATLLEPGAEARKSMAAAVGFAFHHGFTKVSLFLGIGVLARFLGHPPLRRLTIAGLALCSLSLIGFPLTGGAYAKYLLKTAGAPDGTWHSVAETLMTLGSIGTAVLLLRFMILCLRGEHDQARPSDAWGVWAFSIVLVLCGGWSLPLALQALNMNIPDTPAVAESFSAFLPIAFGSFVVAALTFKIWLKHSHLTPRPFDTVMQQAYRVTWEEFPRDFDEFMQVTTHGLQRLYRSLSLEKKGEWIIHFAQRLKTSWILGCTMFVAIGVLIWALLIGGEP